MPKHSEQQQGKSSTSKGKKLFTKKWKDDEGADHCTHMCSRRAPKHEHSHIAEVDMSLIMLGNYTISDHPAVIVLNSPKSGHAITVTDSPSPQEGMDSYLADQSSLVLYEPSHTVTSFSISGITIHNVKPAKAQYEAGHAPYPTFCNAKSLADHIGTQPTTQTLEMHDMDEDEQFVDPVP
ncbi:hypothetical protein CVT25_000092 [Psilocybe cyanescens]|uniref:Uncharacterized protein n=1 Tax=Psilocybe cyanescens TaxID=93625 RepID=A0A409XKF8_PSICY|nr:hypothetical protein CVT25_000092 [Psilocybe cyanescens]